jgi:hypothetical protein
VDVGLGDVGDPQPVIGGEGQIRVDIAARIHDDHPATALVAEGVGEVSQAVIFESVEDHDATCGIQ